MAPLRSFIAELDVFMAELLPFISLPRLFIAEPRAFMAELLPFISLPRLFIAERCEFMGKLATSELQLLPFMGQEKVTLDELALRIAD
jgi:hypothetical protein